MKLKHPRNNYMAQHDQPTETAVFSVVQQRPYFTYETAGKEKLVFTPEKK